MAIQKITIPTGGESTYQIQPGDKVQLGFDTGAASFERVDNSLYIRMDDGSQAILEDFFVGGDAKELPGLVLQDGIEIDPMAFFQSMNPDMDISPAAGPGAGNTMSSGGGLYDDDPGTLIDGIDRLGTLDTTSWSRDTEVRPVADYGGNVTAADEDGADAPVTPPVPGPDPDPDPNPGPDPDPTPDPAPGSDPDTIKSATVDEAGLNDEENSNESATLLAPEGYTIVGVAAQGTHGTVTQDADGNWVYTLNQAIHSGGLNDGANTVKAGDSVKMVVRDTNGNEFEIDVPIDIIDDVPELTVNGGEHTVDSVASGATVTAGAGTIAFDFGADNGAGKSFTVTVNGKTYDITDIAEKGSYTIEGKFGTLTVNADGSYSYQANPNIEGGAQDSFSFAIKDADGDSVTAKVDVSVTDAAGPDGDAIQSATVNEAGLGNEADTSENAAIIAPDGYTIVGVGSQGEHGSVAYDEKTGQWVYTLSEAIYSGGQDDGANTVKAGDSVKMIVQDANGNQYEIDVPIDIIDDVPELAATEQSVTQADGSHEFSASFEYDFGADNGAGAKVSVTVDGGTPPEGTVTVADGKITYTQTEAADKTEFGERGQSHDVKVTVTDADGDTATQTVHLESVGVQVGNEHGNLITGGAGADIIIGDKGHTPDSVENVTYNIALVLDTSKSMEDTTLDNGQSRMQASVEALKSLLDSLADQSGKEGLTINIQLVGFSNTAQGTGWITLTGDSVDSLKAYLNNLTASGQTNYEAALHKVMEAFSSLPPSAGGEVHNSVYFLSDGNPNHLIVDGKALGFSDILKQGLIDDVGYTGLCPAGKDAAGSWTGFATKDQLDQFAKEHPDSVAAAGGKVFPAFMAEATRQWSDFVSEHGKTIFDRLTELGVKVNAVGFAGNDLDKDILDKFDNTDGSQILGSAGDLHELLHPRDVIPGVYAGRDVIYAGAGNDIIFGDHVTFVRDGVTLDGWEALQAAVIAAGGDASSKESIYEFITEHPEFIPSLSESEHDQSDLLVGGAGNDIIAGMGGDDVILGDGENAPASDGAVAYINSLLGGHAQGSDLAAGVHDLMQNGTREEMRDFIGAIEGQGVERHTDGNDTIFGGGGNDVIFGMGGDDIIYGGAGNDIIFGGSGNDVIYGGAGNDIMAGGSGSDTFAWLLSDLPDQGTYFDTILDFNINDDFLDLRDIGLGGDDISAILQGSDLLLSFASGDGGTQQILISDVAGQFGEGFTADDMLDSLLAANKIMLETGT